MYFKQWDKIIEKLILTFQQGRKEEENGTGIPDMNRLLQHTISPYKILSDFIKLELWYKLD